MAQRKTIRVSEIETMLDNAIAEYNSLSRYIYTPANGYAQCEHPRAGATAGDLLRIWGKIDCLESLYNDSFDPASKE